MRIGLIALLVLLSVAAWAAEKKIVIASYNNIEDARKGLRIFLDQVEGYERMSARYGFEASARASGKRFIVVLEPLPGYAEAREVVSMLPPRYDDAFIGKYYPPEPPDAENAGKPKAMPKAPEPAVERMVEMPSEVPRAPEPELVVKTQGEPVAAPPEVPQPSVTDTPSPIAEKASEPEIDFTRVIALNYGVILERINEIMAFMTPEERKALIVKWIVKEKGESAPAWPLYLAGTMLLVLLGFVYAYYRLKRNHESFVSMHSQRKMVVSETPAPSRSNGANDQMLYLSHEIRTPLHMIGMLSGELLKESMSERTKEGVVRIKHSADTLLGLANHMLDASKEKQVVEKKPFNLNEVLGQLSDIAGFGIRGKPVEIVFDVENDVPIRIDGDPIRLYQVLMNLIGNAVKFTDRGEIVLKIEHVVTVNEHVTLGFTVKDSGCGIKTEELDAIFEPFAQAPSSEERAALGTGLGLMIARQMVKSLGGDIQVQSDYGEGSRFYFTANFDLSADGERRKYRLPDSIFMANHIMIVENNLAAAQALQRKLEYMKLKVVSINSWKRALIVLKEAKTKFHYIYVNESVLGPDEQETFLFALNTIASKVVLSAYDIESARKRFGERLYYLRKPYSHQQLFDMLLRTGESHPAVSATQAEPVSVVQHVAPAKVQEAAPRRHASVTRGNRILIVDDNSINQAVLKGILEEDGYRVELASDGAQALELLFADSAFDLILMDVHMPVMGGYETTQILRKEHRFDAIPIIAVSANTAAEEAVRIATSGVDGYISKPLHREQLLNLFDEYIGSRIELAAKAAVKAEPKPSVELKKNAAPSQRMAEAVKPAELPEIGLKEPQPSLTAAVQKPRPLPPKPPEAAIKIQEPAAPAPQFFKAPKYVPEPEFDEEENDIFHRLQANMYFSLLLSELKKAAENRDGTLCVNAASELNRYKQNGRGSKITRQMLAYAQADDFEGILYMIAKETV